MKNLIPKFNSDSFLKRTICNSMYLDANQFLWRVHHLIRNEEFTDRNWFSKIYVDLMMAVESDLKAIIVGLSKSEETPEDAYKKARKKGHDIKNLYAEVELRARNRLKLLSKKDKDTLINKYAVLNVNNRYDLVTFYGIREDIKKGNFTDDSIKYILTHESLLKFEILANDLHQISKNAISKKPILAMAGTNMKSYYERLDKFKTNLGKL